MRPSVAVSLVGSLALGLVLVGCTGQVESGSDSSLVEVESSGTVASGFPAGFNCESIGDLIPDFTSGLYLNEYQTVSNEQIACSWSDIPLDTPFPDATKLDVIVQLRYDSDMDAKYRDSWCEQVRGTPAADSVMTGLGECGRGSLAGDGRENGVGAWIPYFNVELDVSCNLSTECAPSLPESFTDEAGFSALRRIADVLSSS